MLLASYIDLADLVDLLQPLLQSTVTGWPDVINTKKEKPPTLPCRIPRKNIRTL